MRSGASLWGAAIVLAITGVGVPSQAQPAGMSIFVAADGLARGFGAWEKTALAALWLTPLVARSVAHATLIPIGVLAMLAVFILLLRRSTVQLAAPVAFPGAFLLK